MIYELYYYLESIQEKTTILVNPFIVYGVEADTVWRAECIGIVRVRKNSYNVILKNNAQFYRPLKRTSFVFQNNLLYHLRLTKLNIILVNKQKRYYIY